MGASVESLLAELAVVPLGVLLALQAGAWGRDRSTKKNIWQQELEQNIWSKNLHGALSIIRAHR